MLSYISVEIKNNPYRGGIEIISTAQSDTIGNITSVRITRKVYKKIGWTDVYTKDIESVNDLNFKLVDIATVSGTSYSYGIDLLYGNNIIESGLVENIECQLEGLFIGNFDKQYIAGTNFETDARRNTQVEYVTTLAGRTPYRVSNAATNYSTGQSRGLFLKVTNDGKKFIPDYNHDYSKEILDFLTDGTDKILKTNDGEAWFVSIDSGAASPFNEHYYGMNEIRFNWTEVGDLPPFGMVEDDE